MGKNNLVTNLRLLVVARGRPEPVKFWVGLREKNLGKSHLETHISRFLDPNLQFVLIFSVAGTFNIYKGTEIKKKKLWEVP